MIRPIHMPKYGLQQDEGTIVEWRKKEGDRVEKGEILLELETDKALFEYESPESGFLRKITAEEGAVVPVLSVIAVLTDAPDEPFDFIDAPPAAPAAPEPERKPESEPAPQPGTQIRCSPAARRRARELGIDLAFVIGTGPGGRIVDADIETARAALERAPLSRMRKAIGAAMAHSKQTIPHFYLSMDIDMTDAETWRKRQTVKLSATDVLVKATAMSLVRFPALNASLEGDQVIRHKAAHIGLAVGTDEGLVVPVIADAERKALAELAADRIRVVEEARQGRLRGEPKATFTFSNLGMYGVSSFTAIVNPPEAGILAVGAISPRVVPIGEPLAIAVRQVVTVTLSADHRLVDGVIAAQFLQALKRDLECVETVESWM